MRTLIFLRRVLLFVTVSWALSLLSLLTEIVLWFFVDHKVSWFSLISAPAGCILWATFFVLLTRLIGRYAKKHEVTTEYVMTNVFHDAFESTINSTDNNESTTRN